ncbi:COMM domain-containing protein 9-like [Thrips palmi]|uniref:COMM domain-containing protein 9-like n=1 Tax=Thrips palmi TaxID=161013 RepID=A0A6P9ACH7_THRPL|nr:COMM domain-containing protein 9-like [Thrips palmi]
MSQSSGHVGPPRLVDFSCRIQEPDNDSSAACLLTFELENKEALSNSSNGIQTMETFKIDLEMQPATLSTLLDGLGRIRAQLSSVANKK